MIYSKNYQTNWHDTSADRVVRPTRLLVYMQETSNFHMSGCGMSLDKLRDDKHLAFILSKIRLEIHAPLYAFEDIEVQTWTCPAHGLSIPRGYRILRGGELIAEADSTWALLDLEAQRLVRGEDCDVFHFEDEAPAVLDIPTRFKLPNGVELENAGTRNIVWSDLDYNMHMNNTRYPDMLCDHIPCEDIPRIRGFLLSYVNESAFGDVLDIKRAFADNVYYFRTAGKNGRTCLEAEVLLK